MSVKEKHAEWMRKARSIHGNKYSYEIPSTTTSVKSVMYVTCPEHGTFTQVVEKHLSRGQGCSKCAGVRKLTFEEAKDALIRVHGSKYDYSLFTAYTSNREKISIICADHGVFSQDYTNHAAGHGCPICANSSRNESRKVTAGTFVTRAMRIHGNKYSYPESVTQANRKILIHCNRCDKDFTQSGAKHLMGQGCASCGISTRTDKLRTTSDDFVARASAVHNNTCEYPDTYISALSILRIVCKKHGEFHQTPDAHLAGKGCPACAKSKSKGESEIAAFLSQYTTVSTRNKSIITPFELDIVMPLERVAVEYNGLYWHSDRTPNATTRHSKKTLATTSAGYRLVHIYEDEWLYKKLAVQNMLLHAIGKSRKLPGARMYQITVSSAKDVAEFLSSAHLLGPARSGVAHSLVNSAGDVVATMVFSKTKNSRGEVSDTWELVRFASTGSIAGAASRLFKSFLSSSGAKTVVSYSDIRAYSGSVYEKLGFTLEHTTPPNYSVVVGTKRFHKSGFKKQALRKKLASYDGSKTEKQLCHDAGFYRIYDCGLKKWVFQG